jgi:hypothetical protein
MLVRCVSIDQTGGAELLVAAVSPSRAGMRQTLSLVSSRALRAGQAPEAPNAA